MTSIKELLARDIKNASSRIWKKAKTEIPPSEANELARLALEKAIVYKKLREIVEMLPAIKNPLQWYALSARSEGMFKDHAMITDLVAKLDKWENS